MKNIFIHVPRTGGISIKTCLPWVNHHGHMTALQIRDSIGVEEFSSSFKFGFIRNPLDRFVSLFYYLSKLPDNHEWFAPNELMIRQLRGYSSFEEFCLRFRQDNITGYYHFLPQVDYLCIDGKLAVDFLGRTNLLKKDMAAIARLLGESTKKVEFLNQSVHPSARDAYTAEGRKLVEEFYAADMEILNGKAGAVSAMAKQMVGDPEFSI